MVGTVEVIKFYPHEAVEIHSTNKVNGQRLKPYIVGDIDNQKVSFLLNKVG